MVRLLDAIAALRPARRQTRIIAIDGYGASGKSTLAKALAARLMDATIVCTDDFSHSGSSGWDWQRLKAQVLDPLDSDRPARYRRYDWPTGGLAEWHAIPVGGTVIVEGVSSMRRELGSYWDIAIWITCSYQRRLERGVARDGESKRSQWVDVWMPEEDEYVREQEPMRRADLVVSGEEPFPM